MDTVPHAKTRKVLSAGLNHPLPRPRPSAKCSLQSAERKADRAGMAELNPGGRAEGRKLRLRTSVRSASEATPGLSHSGGVTVGGLVGKRLERYPEENDGPG